MKNYFKIALIIILTAGIAVNTTAANLAKESTKKVNMILDWHMHWDARTLICWEW